MGVIYNTRVVTDGLVLCLDAGNRRSYPGTGTVWSDLSGNGNNGTLTNGPTFSGDNGGSIVFDGTNDGINGGNVSISGNACSIAVWWIAKGPPSNNDSAGATLFAQSNQREHGIYISNSWLNQKILFGVVINDGLLSPDNSVINNRINYAVGTYDGSYQKIYINGNISISRAYSLNIEVTSPSYRIGSWGYSIYGRHLQGNIMNVSLYNRALSAQEILQNFNATRGRYGI